MTENRPLDMDPKSERGHCCGDGFNLPICGVHWGGSSINGATPSSLISEPELFS